jgi:hypothetical protein
LPCTQKCVKHWCSNYLFGVGAASYFQRKLHQKRVDKKTVESWECRMCSRLFWCKLLSKTLVFATFHADSCGCMHPCFGGKKQTIFTNLPCLACLNCCQGAVPFEKTLSNTAHSNTACSVL